MVNGGNVLTAAPPSPIIITKEIDLKEKSLATSTSSFNNVKSVVNDELITYHETNFNESNKNSSSECFYTGTLFESEVNISDSHENVLHQVFRRVPRRNAMRKKSNKVTGDSSRNINTTNDVFSQNRGKVSLLGLFELTSRSGLLRAEGKSELAAAELAVKHINERKLLKGYTLELITNDTQVDLIKFCYF